MLPFALNGGKLFAKSVDIGYSKDPVATGH